MPPAGSTLRSSTTVIVLAKAPAPGYAKTRLIPALGADGAARLAERLLLRAVCAARDAGLGPVEVCLAPDPDHPAFARPGIRDRLAGVTMTAQGEGDLGERMARALARRLADDTAVLLIGTDAPDLGASVLREAAAALADVDAVFVPAFDGGYALVGLRRPAPVLFHGVAWSTPTVMAQTRARLVAAGLTWMELDAVADIDEPGDLPRLPPALATGL